MKMVTLLLFGFYLITTVSLQLKMEAVQEKLSNKAGKTGNSSTGEITPEHRDIAKKQTDISKQIMMLKRKKQKS